MSYELQRYFPKAEAEELYFLEDETDGFNADQMKRFVSIYNNKRQDPQTILLLALLGFVVAAGIHRFVMGQVGMGILYLLTAGFCGVGTIIDLINHKQMTNDYNRQLARKTGDLVERF